MWDDPIVAEIRMVRDKYSSRCGHDLKELERTSGRTYVSYPPRLTEPVARGDRRPP